MTGFQPRIAGHGPRELLVLGLALLEVDQVRGQAVDAAEDLEDASRPGEVLLELGILREMDDHARALDAQLRRLLADHVGDGRGAFVGAALDVGRPRGLARFCDGGAGDQQRPGVRHRIVHGADEKVAFDAEVLEQLEDRFRVVLAEGVGLEQVEKQEVVSVLLGPVVDEAVGDRDVALPPADREHGPVSSEVEEVAGPCELAQLEGVEVPLQPGQSKAPNATHIHPRAEHCEGVRLLELGCGLVDFEGPYSHGPYLGKVPPAMQPYRTARLQEAKRRFWV